MGEQGRWSLRKREGDKADSGAHGACFFLGGGVKEHEGCHSWTFSIFSDLQSESISAASLSLPAVHVFSIPAHEGINQSVP